MKYYVIIHPSALDDLEPAFRWIEKHASGNTALRWFDGFVQALESLETFPDRWALAPENPHFQREIRQLLYGRRSGVYRALFAIEGRKVHVLHIRHAAQEELRPEDLVSNDPMLNDFDGESS